MANEKKEFSKKVLEKLGGSGKSGYYVYRLVDPRNFETFYVGKGYGNRVFQHAKAATKMKKEKDEDEESLKIRLIREIITGGKDVVAMIHRWNLTEQEAFEVEAALIDCYPGLTNIQSGHGSDYGLISAEDLAAKLGVEEYKEPDENYIIIKTTEPVVDKKGLYDAVRSAWRADLNKAQKYKYVLGIVNGMVREVYEVSKWMNCVDRPGRIEFIGKPTNDCISELKGKLIPQKYKEKGAAYPFLYKKGKSKNI